MTQINLFDSIEQTDPKRFVAKLFRVECFWHCKIIKGIDIQDRDEYYVIQNTEEDAKRVIKSILFKNGHTGKIGFEYPHKPYDIHPVFLYKGMQVEIMNREGMYVLQERLPENTWSMIGSVPRNGEFVVEEICVDIDYIKPCNSLELSTKYRAKGYIQ